MTRNGKTIVNKVRNDQPFDGLFFNVGGCCGGETSDAELAEVALWTDSIGEENTKAIVGYLSNKWGIKEEVAENVKRFDGSDLNSTGSLRLWIDANSVSGENGEKVQKIDSKSNKPNTLENMSSDKNQWPTIKTNGLNGKKVLSFMTQNNMTMKNNIRADKYTLIFVTRQVGKTNRRFLIGNGNKLFGYWGGRKNILHVEGWLYDPGAPPYKPSDSEWDLMIFRRSAAGKTTFNLI
jgi:hypothetical protein